MSILVNDSTRLVVQGITGHEGVFHAQAMLDYGTNIVAGVTPGKGGEWVLNGKVPVFDSVMTAVEMTGANASVIFVPARFAADAILEAADAGIELIVCITEGIPVKEMLTVRTVLGRRNVCLLGPNTPGIISPPHTRVGIIPGEITSAGKVGVVSRSGTLTYEVMHELMLAGLGTSSCVGIGGDPIVGANFVDILSHFEGDSGTDSVVLIGEIGGRDEELAAEYIAEVMTKPVVGFIAGLAAPAETRMGHAGAIVAGGVGRAVDKVAALEAAGVRVARVPEEVPALVRGR
ncbi:MAG: succinate--CoA ligase subunit alpha [Chloroflexi bacterium]|nr:succinate--CoA ligase subunit alpha [Chloroflexota bacterium]